MTRQSSVKRETTFYPVTVRTTASDAGAASFERTRAEYFLCVASRDLSAAASAVESAERSGSTSRPRRPALQAASEPSEKSAMRRGPAAARRGAVAGARCGGGPDCCRPVCGGRAPGASGGASSDAMTRVCAVEELPRGDRKLVRALGKSVLMFWYRDTVFAIESRSPAEGAYSEGFEKARLTQDACIECPTTKSKFDLKTGAIKEWYPENPVLKALTPQDTCRPMEVFSVE